MRAKTIGTALAAGLTVWAGSRAALADGGTIKGHVTWDGKGPYRFKFVPMNDACIDLYEGRNPPLDVLYDFSNDGRLRNVVVYLVNPPEVDLPIPKEPATLEFSGCMGNPHVLAARVGQPVEVANADPTNHQPHIVAAVNPDLSINLPAGAAPFQFTPKAVEPPIPIRCDIHPWMSAYLVPFDHPFFAVTGEDGTFEFKGLPPGRYVVEAWHERSRIKSMGVTVQENETAEIEFTFSREDRRP